MFHCHIFAMIKSVLNMYLMFSVLNLAENVLTLRPSKMLMSFFLHKYSFGEF